MTLSAGVIRSPALGGPYRLTAQIVSVDPDTGDADDGANQAPTVRGFELPVVIAGPGLVRFRALSVDAFDVDPVERTRASFTIGGRFVLGKNSDGIDLKHEHVEVVLGPFRQTIPGTAFIRSSVGYVYRGAGPGITTLRIKRNGRFAFRAADLHLDLDQWRRLETPALGLRIGNDLGDAPLVPERKDR
jgi:hypothetical protein